MGRYAMEVGKARCGKAVPRYGEAWKGRKVTQLLQYLSLQDFCVTYENSYGEKGNLHVHVNIIFFPPIPRET